jgi:hypothetical protein
MIFTPKLDRGTTRLKEPPMGISNHSTQPVTLMTSQYSHYKLSMPSSSTQNSHGTLFHYPTQHKEDPLCLYSTVLKVLLPLIDLQCLYK